jgi:hypothetical protein
MFANGYTVHAGQHPRNVDGKADREIRTDGHARGNA